MLNEKTISPISQDYISEIISLDDEPILRNLKITQCYYDLSQAIARRIGNENANWCNFATWASKTAGRFIRLEELNERLHHALNSTGDYEKWIILVREKFDELDIKHDFGHEKVHHAAHNILSVISADIAAGNLKVFSELGPVFSVMVEAFDRSLQGDDREVEIITGSLASGESVHGGQDLLRNAILDFHAAMHEKDVARKAELVLIANAQIGLHEQTRLQPYIAAAMEAPVNKRVSQSFHDQVKENSPQHTHHLLHDFFDHLITPLANKVHDAWLNISTHYLMTLIMPDGVLHLGKDLPKPEGADLFPHQLLNPVNPRLNSLLVQYRAHVNTTLHSHARNWANLEDRMHFILNLFRSRQQHKPLHKPPFEDIQEDHIRQNKIPQGKL